jgi:hypothetical protein
MAVKAHYPNLDLSALAGLNAIRMQLKNDPEYLDKRTCPYDKATVADLKEILRERVVEVEKIVTKVVEREKIVERAAEGGGTRGPKAKKTTVPIDSIETEVKDITDELKRLKAEGQGLQTTDKLQIIKVRAALVEKMIGFKERVTNAKKVSHFQSTIFTILDDLMDDDHRAEFLRRMEPFIDD